MPKLILETPSPRGDPARDTIIEPQARSATRTQHDVVCARLEREALQHAR